MNASSTSSSLLAPVAQVPLAYGELFDLNRDNLNDLFVVPNEDVLVRVSAMPDSPQDKNRSREMLRRLLRTGSSMISSKSDHGPVDISRNTTPEPEAIHVPLLPTTIAHAVEIYSSSERERRRTRGNLFARF